MQRIATPPIDRRLQKRYLILVQSHMRHAPKLAAGIATLPGVGSAWTCTQAAWRFLNNDRVSLSSLVEPLRQEGRERANASGAPFVMLVHDWCKLTYRHPARKRDLAQLTHETDVGYELTTALLVSADDGSPLAPMEMHLKTGQTNLSTRTPAPRRVNHLEQILPTMKASQSWGVTKLLLHVIDREADSVDHYRRWDKAGHKFLVRGDDRRVKWQGKSRLLSEIRTQLREDRMFRQVGEARHHGQPAQLWVAETEVVLHRPAKKNVKGKKYERAGRPLSLRFIAVQLRDERGQMILAEWLLLTNLPAELGTAELLARCYYWRWRIESFFKLLKSHGLELEQWLQETGRAIARRLLIAAMACVVVWKLQADESPKAIELKNVLVRLSGRLTKRSRPHTTPALLAGLWVLLSTVSLLEHYPLHKLKQLAAEIFFLDTG
jgi:Transposase DDE domain